VAVILRLQALLALAVAVVAHLTRLLRLKMAVQEEGLVAIVGRGLRLVALALQIKDMLEVTLTELRAMRRKQGVVARRLSEALLILIPQPQVMAAQVLVYPLLALR
jgi:hypothetical protein